MRPGDDIQIRSISTLFPQEDQTLSNLYLLLYLYTAKQAEYTDRRGMGPETEVPLPRQRLPSCLETTGRPQVSNERRMQGMHSNEAGSCIEDKCYTGPHN